MQEIVSEHLHNSTLAVDNPCWYHAMTLMERLASLQAQRSATRIEEPCDRELAARKLQEWKKQDAFSKGINFAQRLEADQLSEEDLLVLLGEPIEAVQQRTPPPDWLLQLAEVFASVDLVSRMEEESQQATQLSLLNIFDIFSTYAHDRFMSRAATLDAEYKHLPFDPQTIASTFLPNLIMVLSKAIDRTMALELNVAHLHGRLHGETPEEYFQEFIQHMRQKQALQALMEEYPVLARQIMIIINRWLDYSLEFLHHLCSDWQQICTTFSPERDPGLLIEAQEGASDGRSVITLRFSSGMRLLYKSRSLKTDLHFQEMLIWLNEQGYHPPFQTVRVLPGEGYGWCEYVEVSACTTRAEIVRFYERQGGQIALLYALHATNVHHENLISSGEHPILIDLETLFHARAKDSIYLDASMDVLQFSVMRVGMLPMGIFSKEGQQGSSLDGDELAYQPCLVAGFKHMYTLLMARSKEFTDGPLARFAHDEIRRTFRPTHFYRQILAESFQPDLLRDALERDRYFDQLWQAVKVQPDLARLVVFERTELLIGTIPLFTTRPDTCDIFSSRADGGTDFFELPGIAIAQQTLLKLHEGDLERQHWFIEASFSSFLMEKEQPVEKHPTATLPAGKEVTRERLLAAACRIGDRLCTLATGDALGVNWIGATFTPENKWLLTATRADLYDGNAGIIFFLSYLGIITGNTQYSDVAEAAYLTMYRQVVRCEAPLQAVGLFEGLGSVIYLLSHLGAIWNDRSMLTEAHRLAKRLPDLIQKDTAFDLLSGSAGCILSLLSLYHVFPEAEILTIACMCGDHLLENARPAKDGLAWTSSVNVEPRTGMPHGTAGCSLSLFALAAISGEERFHRLALATLAYERSVFSPQAQNWPDFLESVEATWCHGAPGIALSRLASLCYIDDEQIRAEIALALKTTVAHFGRNHSLCYGDLGNLDTLLIATHSLDDAWCHEQFKYFRGVILDSIETNGWLTGTPLSIETPGLMTGLAGIGYELLRLAEPERVPSVLVAAPPITKTAQR